MATEQFSPQGVRLPEHVPAGYVLARDCPMYFKDCGCVLMAASAFIGQGIPALAYVDFSVGEGAGSLLYVREEDLPLIASTPLAAMNHFNCLPPSLGVEMNRRN